MELESDIRSGAYALEVGAEPAHHVLDSESEVVDLSSSDLYLVRILV